MYRFAVALTIASALLLGQFAHADLVNGLISDFEDGTLQGWDPPIRHNTVNIPTGGPNGANDNFLQINPAAPSGQIAAVNLGINGVISPAVTAIRFDLMRPFGESDLDIRLVLVGPTTGDRWTSSIAHEVEGDGVWRSYDFSVLEPDLFHASGVNSYADVAAGLNRLLIRWDSGDPPSATGSTGGTGSLGVDNITAIPVPGVLFPFAVSALGLIFSNRRSIRR